MRNVRMTMWLVVVLVLFFVILDSKADVIYSNDFEETVGSEWSSSKITQAPYGEKFFGDWSNAVISLSLDNLPSHTEIELEFDLYIINSMDGNDSSYSSTFGTKGPDIWSLSIQDGPVLLYTTFSNPLHPGITPQSFPDNYSGSHPAQTGSLEVNGLGYNTVSNGYINPVFGDSTYHLAYTFEHTSDSLVVHFQGSGMQDILDESWGLDNVLVDAVPEPATLLLLGMGAFVLRGKR